MKPEALHAHFARRLATWYAAHRREMPWRGERDAYRIWVSEIILQQTRVQQGLDYYRRFLEAFPDVSALARADEDDVLRVWQGLGYYSRARNLHRAAREVAAKGAFPDTLAEVRRLPGIGPYTAAAICSFAFLQPYAVVDGNVLRVVSRFFAERTPIDSAKGKALYAACAQSLLNEALRQAAQGETEAPMTSADFNSAMMDLGATVCLPNGAPLCADCPLAEVCRARAEGIAHELPRKERVLPRRERTILYIYAHTREETVLVRRGEGDIWAGLYELPQAEMAPAGEEPLFACRHVLTHQTLHIAVFEKRFADAAALRAWAGKGRRVVRKAEISAFALPKPLSDFAAQAMR